VHPEPYPKERRDRSAPSQVDPGLPIVHDLAPDLPEVHHLQPYTVRVLEERSEVVRGVLRVVAWLRDLDARLPQLPRRALYGGLVDEAEAQVVQPRRIGVVPGGTLPGRLNE